MDRITTTAIALSLLLTSGPAHSVPAPTHEANTLDQADRYISVQAAHPIETAPIEDDGPASAAIVDSEARDVATTVTGGSETEQLLILDAIESYEARGLSLPPVHVTIHGDREGCGGYAGLYSSNGSEHWIDLCHVSEWVILHELGHAWEAISTSPAIRKAFMEHEDVDTWADDDVHWGQRGTERAANVIATVVRNGACGDVTESYRILTGAACEEGNRGV